MPYKEHGNILFLILIAVALFAALSYTVTQTGRTPGSTIEDEKTKLSQAELEVYAAQLNQGATRLKLINNCSTINLTPPADQVAGEKSCHMFHPDGAGVAYRDFGETCPSTELLENLAIGGRCGTVVFAGDLGGRRIYTTISDLGVFTWNNGSTNWTVTGATSASDGKANTDILASLSDAGAPYEAANACRALGPDWYLPSRNELLMLHANRDAIGGFNTTSWPIRMYKSSTEFNAQNADTVIFPEGTLTLGGHRYKSVGRSVRCVRRFE